MSCHVICTDTTDHAIDLANQLEEHGKTDRISFIAARALGPGLVGTPDLIADRIRGYEAAGVGMMMLHFHPMVDGMERFAREVMPLVKPGERSSAAEKGAV
jgi:FMNH2-dependent dimethyl sulfone monooxygenase